MNSEELHDYYAAVGRFVVHWATLESELDLLLLSTRFHHAPAERLAKEPYSLREKLKQVRKRIEKISALDPMRDRVGLLLDEIKRLSTTRDDIVHGAVFEDPPSPLLVSLLQPRGPRRPARRITTGEIEHLGDEIWDLSGRMLDLLEALPKEPHEI